MKVARVAWTVATCVALVGISTAHAIPCTRTVTNTANSGFGSLRDAIVTCGMDGATIDATGVHGTITLTTGEILVSNSMTIQGPADPNTLTVSGNDASRVFHIATGKTVTISRFIITHGSATGGFPGGCGGGVFNDLGTLTLSDSAVTTNSASEGGGICNSADTGTAMLTVA